MAADELTALISMADCDKRIVEIRRHMKRIPRELAEARRQLDAEQVLLDEVKGPHDQAEAEVHEKNATIQVALDTIAKFEDHMERVNTQKEYMAARKQIEEARKLNDRLQNEILAARQRQEELAPRLEEVLGRYNKVREAYTEDEGKILQVQEAHEKDIADLERIKAQAAERVERPTRKLYERLTRGGMVPALVEVRDGVCSGCHIAVPPQVYNQVLANPTRFYQCNHCQRMLYCPSEETKEEEARQAG